MNWPRGFFKLWVIGSLAWLVIILSAAVEMNHVVLNKPTIVTVHWGKEDIPYSAALSEEEIKFDLRRRADKMHADDEENFRRMPLQKQKEFCNSNRNTPFDKLPQYCQLNVFHDSTYALPEGWEEQIRFPPRTIYWLDFTRAAGRAGGRPPKLTDDDIEAARAMLANTDIGVTQIAHRLGVSPASLYRYIPAARTANTPGV